MDSSHEHYKNGALSLQQALLGAISANFRMITLEYAPGQWTIHYVLREKNHTDLEEIRDIETEFEVLLPQNDDKIRSSITYTKNDITMKLKSNHWVIFRSRDE